MKYYVLLIVLTVSLTGCALFENDLRVVNGYPVALSAQNIKAFKESPLYGRLLNEYGKGEMYERVKIQYLLSTIRQSDFSYLRNGYTYKPHRFAKHIAKKYSQKFDEIYSARDFIKEIASRSWKTGKQYLVIPGDGYAYPTNDVLTYELERMEGFVDRIQEEWGRSVNAVKSKANGG